jgi:hypothetical protein
MLIAFHNQAKLTSSGDDFMYCSMIRTTPWISSWTLLTFDGRQDWIASERTSTCGDSSFQRDWPHQSWRTDPIQIRKVRTLGSQDNRHLKRASQLCIGASWRMMDRSPRSEHLPNSSPWGSPVTGRTEKILQVIWAWSEALRKNPWIRCLAPDECGNGW